MDRKFEDIIKRKMDGFSKEVPDRVWENIEKDMMRKSRSNRRPLVKTVSLVAATLVAASLVGLLFYRNMPVDQPQLTAPVSLSDNSTAPQQDSSATYTATPESPREETAPSPKKTTAPAAVRQQYSLAAAAAQPAEQPEQAVTAAPQQDTPEETTEKQHIQPFTAVQQHTESHRSNSAQRSATTPRRQKQQKEGWSISFSADGNNGEYTKQTTGFIPTLSTSYNMLKANEFSEMAYISNSSVSYVKHHMPVTASMTITKKLWKGLSVETGVQYSMLKSDLVTEGKSKYNAVQRLQYLGIPVKLNYTFIRIKNFSAYASAGACFEKCISGNVDYKYMPDKEPESEYSEKIAIKQLQYSLLASAGIKYNITDFMGVYFEPGMAYFFNDGSEYDTYRKAHPLMLSLRLGVSFDF